LPKKRFSDAKQILEELWYRKGLTFSELPNDSSAQS